MKRRILAPLALAGAVALAALAGCTAAPPTSSDPGASSAPEVPETPATHDCPDGFIGSVAGNAAGAAEAGVEISEIEVAEFEAIVGLPVGSFDGGCAFTASLAGIATAGAYLPGATDVVDVFLAAGAADQGEQSADGIEAHAVILDGTIVAIVQDGLAALEASGVPEALEYGAAFPDGLAIVTAIYDAGS